MINIAVLGYGTVGSGVVEVIRTNHELINKRAGEEIKIKYVLDLREFPGDPVEEILVHDFEQIVNDPEVKIVVEVMGGTGAAYTFTKRALEAGKSVCTSNKALVAQYGPELMEIAKEKKINFLFEASCGGGIPIIRAINGSLTADEIDEVSGILNGTTNYMLDKMITEGADFNTVLKEAQEKGYAEADPTADVEGQDACRKIAILSSLAYGKFLNFENVYTEGITKITPEDMEYAREMGRSIKLLGTSKKLGDDSFYALVAPFLVGQENPLYGVKGVFNSIFVHGNMLGDAMFYGRGAGELPTASAIVGDVLDVVRNMEYGCTGRIGCGCYRETQVKSIADVKNKFFLRMQVTNQPGVLASIANVFGKHKVSIERIIQKDVEKEKAELVIVTEYVKEGYLQEALDELMQMPILEEISSKIRVY